MQYYTTKEVEPSTRVPIYTCSGVALFIPMMYIRFFTISAPKIPHSRFGAGSKSGTFGQGMVKEYFAPYVTDSIHKNSAALQPIDAICRDKMYGALTGIQLELNLFS